MKLIYAYVRSFKNIQEQEFMLSDDYDVFFEENRLTIDKTDNDIGFVFERSENMKQSVVLPPHE